MHAALLLIDRLTSMTSMARIDRCRMSTRIRSIWNRCFATAVPMLLSSIATTVVAVDQSTVVLVVVAVVA